MKPPETDDAPSSRVPRPALVAGGVAAVVTGGVVSSLTLDGNLVVTSVPALVVGSAVFGITLLVLRWRRRR